MAPINTTARRNATTSSDFVILPSDVYRMKIAKAVIEENRFGEVQADGTKPLQLVITWEVTTLSEEQADAAADAAEAWVGAAVWQRINPYYGPVRDGGVSRFKSFVDNLRAQGYLTDFNPEMFDPESLVGIEQKVTVEEYIKSQGDNKGSPGNKVVSVLPIKTARVRREEQRKAAEAEPVDVL